MENTLTNTNLINNDKKQPILRNSAIELLRVIAMFFIVFHHFAVHGGFIWDSSNVFSIEHFWYNFIVSGGKIGVNVFVLISGYFLIQDKRLFNLRRILKFWGQVFFYSIAIYLIFIAFGKTAFGIKDLIKHLFPILFGQWWFATTYFVLYLLHPFINKFLLSLDKKIYKYLLILLFFIWCVIPTFTTKTLESNYLLWFITLYSFAGYYRIYGFSKKLNKKWCFLGFVVFGIILYSSTVVFTLLSTKFDIFGQNTLFFIGAQKLPALGCSIFLFLLFSKINMKDYKWINIISSTTFAVYLISDSNLMREYLWTELFKNASYQNSILLIPYSIIVVLIIFVGCIIIDLLRKYTIEKLYIMVVDKFCNFFIPKLKSVFSKI